LDDVRQALTDLGVRSVIRDERFADGRLDEDLMQQLRRVERRRGAAVSPQ